MTTLATIAAQLTKYDASRVHGSTLDRERIESLCHDLARRSLAERLEFAGLERGRADVIVAGACIVRSIMRWSGAHELVVSDRGVRWGLLRRLAREGA